MKTAVFLLLLSNAMPLAAKAKEPQGMEAVLSTSPDGRIEVVARGLDYYDGLEIRYVATKKSVPFDGPFAVAEGERTAQIKAIWSTDSKRLALVNPQMNIRSYGEITISGEFGASVIEFKEGASVAYSLPEDTLPVKWTKDGVLICSIRTKAVLHLDSDTKAFAPATLKKGAKR